MAKVKAITSLAKKVKGMVCDCIYSGFSKLHAKWEITY